MSSAEEHVDQWQEPDVSSLIDSITPKLTGGDLEKLTNQYNCCNKLDNIDSIESFFVKARGHGCLATKKDLIDLMHLIRREDLVKCIRGQNAPSVLTEAGMQVTGGEIQDLAVAESGVAPSFEAHPEIVSGKMNMTSGTVYSKCQAIQKSESEHEENEQVTDIKVQRIRTPSDENLHRSGSPQEEMVNNRCQLLAMDARYNQKYTAEEMRFQLPLAKYGNDETIFKQQNMDMLKLCKQEIADMETRCEKRLTEQENTNKQLTIQVKQCNQKMDDMETRCEQQVKVMKMQFQLQLAGMQRRYAEQLTEKEEINRQYQQLVDEKVRLCEEKVNEMQAQCQQLTDKQRWCEEKLTEKEEVNRQLMDKSAQNQQHVDDMQRKCEQQINEMKEQCNQLTDMVRHCEEQLSKQEDTIRQLMGRVVQYEQQLNAIQALCQQQMTEMQARHQLQEDTSRQLMGRVVQYEQQLNTIQALCQQQMMEMQARHQLQEDRFEQQLRDMEMLYQQQLTDMEALVIRAGVHNFVHFPPAFPFQAADEDQLADGDVPTPEDVINNLQNVPADHLDDSPCSICLAPIRENEENEPLDIREMPRCGHRFHFNCIQRWLGRRNTCPLCRTPVE